jgi:hypothetical protein
MIPQDASICAPAISEATQYTSLNGNSDKDNEYGGGHSQQYQTDVFGSY